MRGHMSCMTAESPLAPPLPPEPERPDCCAGGCAICVLDDYFEQMQRWRAEVAAIEAARAERSPPAHGADG